MIFIKLLEELKEHIDVNKLAVAIASHIAETKEASTRFACRFIPIDVLCKAKNDDLKAFMLPMLRKYFTLS